MIMAIDRSQPAVTCGLMARGRENIAVKAGPSVGRAAISPRRGTPAKTLRCYRAGIEPRLVRARGEAGLMSAGERQPPGAASTSSR